MQIKKSLVKVAATLVSSAAIGGILLVSSNNAHADSIYTVKAGDSVTKIDREFGMSNPTSIHKSVIACYATDHNYVSLGEKLDIVTDGGNKYIKPATEKEVKILPKSTADNNEVSVPAKSNSVVTSGVNNHTASNARSYTSGVSGSEAAAKSWIAYHESGNNWNARNGQYIGKYQITASYLHGDYSIANQERVVDNYVRNRYGSWNAAKSHWLSHNWY